MSESFRTRVKRMERVLNKMSDYERTHELEWCPISDEILKQMYPDECQSQEGRDRKAETLPQEEFELIFDAVMNKYRMRKKKKQQQQQSDQQDQEEAVETEKEVLVAEK
jgi:hypothetical protein